MPPVAVGLSRVHLKHGMYWKLTGVCLEHLWANKVCPAFQGQRLHRQTFNFPSNHGFFHCAPAERYCLKDSCGKTNSMTCKYLQGDYPKLTTCSNMELCGTFQRLVDLYCFGMDSYKSSCRAGESKETNSIRQRILHALAHSSQHLMMKEINHT